MPQIAFSVPGLLTFELIQNPAHLHITSRSVQQVKSFATYSLWRAFDPPSRKLAIRSSDCVERTAIVSARLRWTLQMLASARKTVSLYLIALRLALAVCAAHSPTATLDAREAAWDSTHWQGCFSSVSGQLSDSTSYTISSCTWVQAFETFLLEIFRLFSKFRDDMTILNKILFRLLKFYFTWNTGRKTTSYTFSTFHMVSFCCSHMSGYIPCTKDSRN